MGERVRQARARAFRQQQCRHYQAELREATLFSRTPDVLQRSYCCESGTPVHHLVGRTVLIQPRADGVAVIDGNVEIGYVTGEDAKAITRAVADEPLCPGFAVAVIEDASSITPEFDIRLVDHTKKEGE
jgi:hypothetical protein